MIEILPRRRVAVVDEIGFPGGVEPPDDPNEVGSLDVDRHEPIFPLDRSSLIVGGQGMGRLFRHVEDLLPPRLRKPTRHELLETIERVLRSEPSRQHFGEGDGRGVKRIQMIGSNPRLPGLGCLPSTLSEHTELVRVRYVLVAKLAGVSRGGLDQMPIISPILELGLLRES